MTSAGKSIVPGVHLRGGGGGLYCTRGAFKGGGGGLYCTRGAFKGGGGGLYCTRGAFKGGRGRPVLYQGCI